MVQPIKNFIPNESTVGSIYLMVQYKVPEWGKWDPILWWGEKKLENWLTWGWGRLWSCLNRDK